MKQILIVTLVTFLLLTSCDNFLTSEEKEGVYLEYLGKSTEFHKNNIAEFELINNTDKTIEYWGYSSTSPFYSYQIKNDTGWSSNMIGWCGTGAVAIELSAEASVEFTSSIPDSLCIWRLTFNYNIKDLEKWETIYSEPILNKP